MAIPDEVKSWSAIPMWGLSGSSDTSVCGPLSSRLRRAISGLEVEPGGVRGLQRHYWASPLEAKHGGPAVALVAAGNSAAGVATASRAAGLAPGA